MRCRECIQALMDRVAPRHSTIIYPLLDHEEFTPDTAAMRIGAYGLGGPEGK